MQPDSREDGLDNALLREGLITRTQRDAAREEYFRGERPITSVLVGMGVLTENAILNFLRRELGFELVSLANLRVAPELQELVPKPFAARHCLAPVRMDGETLVVAMEDPTDFKLIEDLSERAGCPIKAVVASSADINKALATYPDDELLSVIARGRQSRARRILSYCLLPMLLPAPIAVLLGLMVQTLAPSWQIAVSRWVSTGFNFAVSFAVIWGVWAVGLWYINGLIFPPAPDNERP